MARKFIYRILSFMLVISLALTGFPILRMPVFAETGEVIVFVDADTATPGTTENVPESDDTTDNIIIAAFDELPEETLWQGYDYGAIESQDDLILPDTLTGTDADGNSVTVTDIAWESEPEFDPLESILPPGYVFSAVLPQGYELAEGITLPVISVFIRPEGGVQIMPLAATQANDFASLQNAINGAPTDGTETAIEITANIQLGGELTIAEGKNIKIWSATAYTIKAAQDARLFTVKGEFALENYVTLEGTGTVSDSNNAHVGAAGGGVYIAGGTFIMNGGEISGNTVGNGGGVFISYGASVSNGGIFILNGGKVNGNTGFYGGGVNVHYGSSFTMNGGEISGNASGSGGGGGVWVDLGTFTMTGGKISGNSADSAGGVGGGVHVRGTFTITGGEISDNSSGFGGGVSLYDSTVNINGGKIIRNAATQSSGGIYASADKIMGDNITITMTGGEISDNVSTSTVNGGGGITVAGADFTMSGGKISGNVANARGGGGVEVINYGTFTMTGGEISNNTAPNGGGVYFSDTTYVNLDIGASAIFSGNTATGAPRVYDGTPDVTNYIKTTSSSYAGLHPLNNHDINYSGGTEAIYAVTFKDWNDTTLKTQTVNYGQAATAPANPTRAGYTFTGWNVAFSNITSNLTVTAQYSVNSYTVTFKDWNSTTLKTETVNGTQAATAPADPTRTGYTFTGWDKAFNSITSDLIVTAQYSINTYTVTFKDWDDTTLKTQTVNHGQAATAPTPARLGYNFTGWDTTTFNNVTSNLTVKAQYTIKPTDDIREEAKDDSLTPDDIKELDELFKNEANISVGVAVDSNTHGDFKNQSGKISVVGAALNAQPNSTVSLNFTKPDNNEEVVIDGTTYKANTAVQVKISLVGAGDTSNLDVPITITVPIPTGLGGNQNLFWIIHRRSNGSLEYIKPTINGDGTCTFVVTGFSVFVFVDEVSSNPVVGNNSSSNRSSSSKSKSDNYTPVSPASITSGNVNTDGSVNSNKISGEFNQAMKSSSSPTITLKTRNAKTMSASTIKKLAALAAKSGKTAIIHADTINEAGNIQGRLYVEPAKLTGLNKEIRLGIFTEGVAVSTRERFMEKWYSNKMAVISCTQQGDFGAELEIAAKIDLTKMGTKNLVFYSYDAATNKFTKITTQYRIDSKGYIHFKTNLAGDIIVSDGVLVKR